MFQGYNFNIALNIFLTCYFITFYMNLLPEIQLDCFHLSIKGSRQKNAYFENIVLKGGPYFKI